jgi:hypothetical protein
MRETINEERAVKRTISTSAVPVDTEQGRGIRSSTVLWVSTVLAVVLYGAATLALGTPPDGTADGQAVTDWFASQGEHVRTWAWLLTLSAPVYATVATLIRDRLPAPYRDVYFFGAIAFVVETAIQSWLWAGLSWHTDQLQPATARTLLDVALFWGPVLTGATVTMLAPIVLLALRGKLPRWLGILQGIALTEQLIETVTVFGHTGFTAPGGPMNIYLGAGLVAASGTALGITLAFRPPVVADRERLIKS